MNIPGLVETLLALLARHQGECGPSPSFLSISSPTPDGPRSSPASCSVVTTSEFNTEPRSSSVTPSPPVAYIATTLRNLETYELWERSAEAAGLMLEPVVHGLNQAGHGLGQAVHGTGQATHGPGQSAQSAAGSHDLIQMRSVGSTASTSTPAVRFLHRAPQERSDRVVITRVTRRDV